MSGYVDGVGSFVILYAIIIDQALDPDTPSVGKVCPEGCNLCIKACPTAALASYHLTPNRCVGFNNWMRKVPGNPYYDTTIPRDIRPLLGTRIHGCDECQLVCPHNHEKVNGSFQKDPFLEELAKQFASLAVNGTL